jgi:hypothetical protein
MAANVRAEDPPMTHDRLGRPLIGPCLIWTRALDGKGYGAVGNKDFGSYRIQRAHRVAYGLAHDVAMTELDSIPELDHLCRVTECCSADHLEPVTHGENIRRGDLNVDKRSRTHCLRKHAYDASNTVYTKRGTRSCRICKNDRSRRVYDPLRRSARYQAKGQEPN